jgi:hypothetical protein
MEMSGQLHAPATLLLNKTFMYSLDRRFRRLQDQSGLSDDEKNTFPYPSSPLLVARPILTEISPFIGSI